jgi:hypothetical protein
MFEVTSAATITLDMTNTYSGGDTFFNIYSPRKLCYSYQGAAIVSDQGSVYTLYVSLCYFSQILVVVVII